MKKYFSNNQLAVLYSVVVVISSFIAGQIILRVFPNRTNIGAFILFVCMNLTPMVVAGVMSITSGEVKNLWHFLEKVFAGEEKSIVWILSLAAPIIYYGVSIALNNVKFTGYAIGAVLAYFPWILLQCCPAEIGWRWYLQEHLLCKKCFIVKMMIISVVYFAWYLPICMLPWISTDASKYLNIYLFVLGNTFMFGAIKELSKGIVPCVIAHMLIDGLVVIMLVQNSLWRIVALVSIEILLSICSFYFFQRKTNEI